MPSSVVLVGLRFASGDARFDEHLLLPIARAGATKQRKRQSPKGRAVVPQALAEVESLIGKPLSPYAVTKLANELYAEVFSSAYGFPSIGLRYFNIFGARQDPDGPYAAVIPKWIAAMMHNETIYINGDGESTRDFCYVANAVQANLLAATTVDPAAVVLPQDFGASNAARRQER